MTAEENWIASSQGLLAMTAHVEPAPTSRWIGLGIGLRCASAATVDVPIASRSS
jgi:hypothetical protein